MTPERPFKILVAYDFSVQADVALAQALELAATHPHVRLHLLAVLDGRGRVAPHRKVDYQVAEEVQQELQVIVDEQVRTAGLQNVVAFTHARIGHAADEIVRMIVETQADITVIGTHGHGRLERFVLGSVAERVVRHAAGPVLVARPRDYASAELTTGPEPACPDCVKRREETGGAEWWCQVHAKPYVPPRRYAYRAGAPTLPDTASGGWLIY